MPTNNNRTTNWLLATVLIAASILIALLITETFIRVFYPQRLYYNISQWDEYVGFRLIPNIESNQKHPEYDMHIKINSRGLRDREYPFEKPSKTIRIGVFGDSFTFGEGVESDKTYAKQLEQKFAAEPSITKQGWKVEVLNFGIGKTGTAHQLAWYQKEGVKYGLDIVLLGFLAGNDFDDNLAGVFRLENGKLIHNPAAYSSIRKIQGIVYSIPFYRWLAEHSHLVNWLRKTATILDDKRRQNTAPVKMPVAEDQTSQGAYAVDLTYNLIKRFANDAKANHCEFLMLSLPRRNQRPIKNYTPGEKMEKTDEQLAQLQAALNKEKITLIDFVPIFAALPSSKYYYETDGHWRVDGHTLVAAELYEKFKSRIYMMTAKQYTE